MNIKQALKEKNKTVKRITEEFNRFALNNSIEKGSERSYDPRESMNNWLSEVDKLISLKAKIHSANSKVYDKIFRLSELKSIVKQLKNLDCSNGKQPSSYRREEPVIKETVVTLSERDQLLKKFENEIESLQEELDIHNAKTKI